MSDVESLLRLRKAFPHEKAIVFIYGISAKSPQEYWNQFTTILLQDTHALIKDFDYGAVLVHTNKDPKWLVDFVLCSKNEVDEKECLMSEKPLHMCPKAADQWSGPFTLTFDASQYSVKLNPDANFILTMDYVACVLC